MRYQGRTFVTRIWLAGHTPGMDGMNLDDDFGSVAERNTILRRQ